MSIALFGVFHFAEGTGLRDAAIRIYRRAARHGIGIRLGLWNIPALTKDDAIVHEILRELAKGSRNPIPFDLTSNPLDDNIEELFESEFNVVPPTKVKRSSIAKLLRDVWEERDLSAGSVVVYEKPGPSLSELPRTTTTLVGLIDHLANFFVLQASDPRHGMGIFDVSKETSSLQDRDQAQPGTS